MTLSKASTRVGSTSRVILLFAVLVAQNYLPAEYSAPFIVFLGFGVFIFGRTRQGLLKFVFPFVIVLAVGSSGLFGYEARDVLRDLAYALTPNALLGIGFWIASDIDMWPVVLRVFIVVGLIMACIHLAAFFFDPSLLTADLSEIREVSPGNINLVILAFLFGLFQRQFGSVGLFPKGLPGSACMLILLASFILAYSRTTLVVAVVVALSLAGLGGRFTTRLGLMVALIVAGYFVFAATVPEGEEGTFRSKLVRSIEEITIADYSDMEGINKNWRGYEASRTSEAFHAGTLTQMALGQGFGATVDLGFYMPLGGKGDVEFRYLPIMHNGYVYILLKCGVLGLVCYLLFYFNTLRFALRYTRSMENEQKMMARLLIGCVLGLIFSMYVVGGMAEAHSGELVLLTGFLVRRLRTFGPTDNSFAATKAA